MLISRCPGESISSPALRDNLKKRCGFQSSDFQMIPMRRNTEYAIEARYRYSQDIKDEEDQMREAIYIDESSWSSVKHGKGWSIKGIRPVKEHFALR
jgi:hypothetical protein